MATAAQDSMIEVLGKAPPDCHEVRLLAEVGEAAVDVVPELRNLQHQVGHIMSTLAD
jgi:hypothetical protein